MAWNNVGIPDFSSTLNTMQRASALATNHLNNAFDSIDDIRKAQQNKISNALAREALANSDNIENYNKFLKSIANNSNYKNVDANTLYRLGDRTKDILSNSMNQRKYNEDVLKDTYYKEAGSFINALKEAEASGDPNRIKLANENLKNFLSGANSAYSRFVDYADVNKAKRDLASISGMNLNNALQKQKLDELNTDKQIEGLLAKTLSQGESGARVALAETVQDLINSGNADKAMKLINLGKTNNINYNSSYLNQNFDPLVKNVSSLNNILEKSINSINLNELNAQNYANTVAKQFPLAASIYDAQKAFEVGDFNTLPEVVEHIASTLKDSDIDKEQILSELQDSIDNAKGNNYNLSPKEAGISVLASLTDSNLLNPFTISDSFQVDDDKAKKIVKYLQDKEELNRVTQKYSDAMSKVSKAKDNKKNITDLATKAKDLSNKIEYGKLNGATQYDIIAYQVELQKIINTLRVLSSYEGNNNE